MKPKIHISKEPLTETKAVAEVNKIIIKKLTSMIIHDVTSITDEVSIQRVPGGWHYIYVTGQHVSISFVPLPKSLSIGY